MTKQEFLEKLRAALGNDLSGTVVSENVNYYKQYNTKKITKIMPKSDQSLKYTKIALLNK